MSMRVLSLFVVLFFFLATFEAWAGYWLAGRWFISSRYASVTLGTVKSWLDRGLITTSTQTVKTFVQRNGKWILLTLALGQAISEVQNRLQGSEYCYDANNPLPYDYDQLSLAVDHITDHVYLSGRNPVFLSLNSYSCSGNPGQTAVLYLTTYRVYHKSDLSTSVGRISPPGTYTLTTPDGVICTATLTWTRSLQPCGSSSDSWQNERREVSVRVFPNPADFVRPDLISQDSVLSWLNNEYQRIAADSSIPTVPASDVDLPAVDWSVPSEEAADQASESSESPPGTNENEEANEGVISVPGLDANLNVPAKRSFPIELINSVVQSHPLLRVLSRVSVDSGGSGSCVIGSSPFQFDFCNWGWVLNIMGGVIVFVSFVTGLVWTGRSE